MRVLISGGTGFIGPCVVRRLIEDGHEVSLFHRGQTTADLPSGVSHIYGGRQNLRSFIVEFKKFLPHVVLDMFPYIEQDAVEVVQTFRGVAERVVAISSMDVYCAYGHFLRLEEGVPDPVPFDENAPLRSSLYPYRALAQEPNDPYHNYEKILIERVVMSAADLPGTILRLSKVYGPGDNHHRLFDYLKRMDDNRPAILLDGQKAHWCWTRGYVENVADTIALAIAAILRDHFPEEPYGYFISADIYQTVMRDFRVTTFQAEFDNFINLAIKSAWQALKRQRTGENYALVGATEGYQGLHQFRRGEWLKAIHSAIRSIRNLEISIRLDPTLVDPLLGLAIYEYGKSKALSLGIGLFSGKRQKAMLELKKVRSDGKYARVSATYALLMIHYEAGEYAQALELNEQLYLRFPQNPVCLYNRALLLEKLSRPHESLAMWCKLIECIQGFAPPSNGYLAESHYHLAELYQQRHETNKALEHLRLAEKYDRLYVAEEEMDGIYTSYKETRQAIQKAAASWGIAVEMTPQ